MTEEPKPCSHCGSLETSEHRDYLYKEGTNYLIDPERWLCDKCWLFPFDENRLEVFYAQD